jgi:hypothetical protein
MSEVDALYRLLADAPPRSAEIVKRVTLAGMDFPELAKLYGVDVARAQILVFRSFLDVSSGGKARVPDERESLEVSAMIAPASTGGEGAQARQLWERMTRNRDELKVKLAKSAAEYAASPDRDRDEWLRRAAIVLVLALTAFFYWREQNKPKPPLQKRPIVQPVQPVTPP